MRASATRSDVSTFSASCRARSPCCTRPELRSKSLWSWPSSVRASSLWLWASWSWACAPANCVRTRSRSRRSCSRLWLSLASCCWTAACWRWRSGSISSRPSSAMRSFRATHEPSLTCSRWMRPSILAETITSLAETTPLSRRPPASGELERKYVRPPTSTTRLMTTLRDFMDRLALAANPDAPAWRTEGNGILHAVAQPVKLTFLLTSEQLAVLLPLTRSSVRPSPAVSASEVDVSTEAPWLARPSLAERLLPLGQD